MNDYIEKMNNCSVVNWKSDYIRPLGEI